MVEPKAINKENKWQAIPPEIAPPALPYFAIAKVVSASGRALPIDKTTIPKNEEEMSNIIPIKFIELTKISHNNLFHNSPLIKAKIIIIIK